MQLYWIWYAQLKGLSLRQKLTLLTHFSDPEEIYNAKSLPTETELDHDLTQAEAILRQCVRKSIRVLPMDDDAYPHRLRNISDPPLVLYCRGVLVDFRDMPAIGVVGTRKASAYGLRIAKELSAQLTQGGALVVSGGAAGVDTCALEGALLAGMPAVAVLGCGVDVVYPVSNRKLFMDLEAHGCLVSEYPPGTEPVAWHFPERNRIISGICNGVLVVEAPEKSGALITAREAMEQGRDVYVVPANIDLATGKGSNLLLQEGAYAVFSGWDILRQYAAQYTAVKQVKPGKTEPATAVSTPEPDKKSIDNPAHKPYSVLVNDHLQLTEQEAQVLACVGCEAVPVDTVISRLDLPAATVLSILTKLSLRGIVRSHPGKLISRNP